MPATMPAVAGCLNEPFRFEGTLKGDALQGRIVFPASSPAHREQTRRLRAEGVPVKAGRVAASALTDLETL